METIKNAINKKKRFMMLGLFGWVPDKPWLKFLYRIKNGCWMDFNDPCSFNEKLQWLKVYGIRPEYTKMVDKYTVKDFVAARVGDEYVIPTLGVWDKTDDIELDSLPNEFVLKTTHGGGGYGVVICENKDSFDRRNAIKSLNESMSFSVGNAYREYPYLGVQKRIIAEALIKPENGGDLRDYKFFCFNGTPRFFKIDFDRQTNHKANYYSLDGKLLPYGEVVCPPDPNADIEIPSNLSKMIHVAQQLSKGIPFVRVDLYNVDGHVYFGELTFFPASGLAKWTDKKWDKEIGEMLELPKI